ncbi:hypothetical protein JOF28_002361 [Leucobacter exalbidus]|uniref:SLH domain-containing protein n=1 Tax=Leucobacter exalbidus TaxID=662960 RepID=A0A940PXF5_9MICO|nr:hypothetical protein [Leucobacter exalbidus]
MRYLSRAVAGGVLAVALVLSGSPAQAFQLNDARLDAGLRTPATAEALSDAVPGDAGVTEAEADGNGTSAAGEGPAAGDSAGGDSTGGDSAGGDSAADADADADADAGSGPSADAGSEAQADAGAGVEPDADSDAGSEAGADAVDDSAGSGADAETAASANEGAETPADETSAADTPDRKTVKKQARQTNPAAGSVTVPEQLAVDGNIIIVPDEHGAISLEDLTAGHVPEVSAGAVLVATSDLGTLPVDVAAVQGDIVPGGKFSGVVTLSDEAIEATEELWEASDHQSGDEPSAAEVAELAVAAAADVGQPLVADGTVTPTAASEAYTSSLANSDAVTNAAVSRSHPVDIVNFGGTARTQATQAEMTKIVTDTSAFWKSQTNGQISAMPVASYRAATTKLNLCMDPTRDARLWDEAAKKAGFSDMNRYVGSGRHLVVFVNANCDSTVGWGNIGTLHSGGVTWINLGARPAGVAVSDMTHTTAHEIGHNLGLGHGDARSCASPHSAGPTSGVNGYPTGGRGCQDFGYLDLWNVMGMYLQTYGTKPPALAMSQKRLLGVTNSTMLKEVTSSGGLSQTFTLSGAGLNSGLRGLRVQTPSPGGTIFVEYRNGLGQDSGLAMLGRGEVMFNRGTNQQVSVGTGVKVMQGYAGVGRRSVAANTWSGGSRHLTMNQGATHKTYGDTARVYVSAAASNATASTASVRVMYKGFKPGGKTVSIAVEKGGSALAGKKLQAKLSGRWAVSYGGIPTSIKLSYRWYRDGKAISGATGKSYRTKASDTGKRITVRVKPSAAGYVTGAGSLSSAKKIAKTPYYDVAWGHKYYKETAWVKSRGITATITSGGKSYFKPTGGLTRSAMAVFMYNLNTPKGATKPRGFKVPKKSPFKDVSTKHKYYKQIAWMSTSGIYTGTKTSTGHTFSPGATVTRALMANVTYRMDKKVASKTSFKAPAKSPFRDVSTKHKNYKQIAWMYKTNLHRGVALATGRSKYQPTKKVTRQEFARVLYRYTH